MPAPPDPIADPRAVADALDEQIRALPWVDPPVEEMRRLRRAASQDLRRARPGRRDPAQVGHRCEVR